MAMIAHKCPRYRVTIVDINPDRITQWNSDHLLIYEPGLDEIVLAARGRNLFFSTDIENGIREADIIFVSVNTPTKTFGVVAGMAADLQYWEKTARQILENATSDKIIVEKSTLPVRTARAMERILCSAQNGVRFEVLSNPEFLAEGTAIKYLEHPDRVLIGSRQTESGLKAKRRAGGDLCQLGTPGSDHDHGHLEQRAVQAGRQCLFGSADLLYQCDFGALTFATGWLRTATMSCV